MTAVTVHFLRRALVALTVVGGLLVSGLAVAGPAQAKVRDNFFGIHDFAISTGELPRVTTGAIRLWDSGTSWREIERTRGNFDWSVLDAAVTNAQAKGLRPMIVLGQTPRFHARDPRAAGSYGPGASSMPALKAWKRYVGRVAQRYGTGVDYQVWNEPNVINYWTGSLAQMATLTVTASHRIHQELGSKAVVVGPSFPLRLRYQQDWYKAFWHQSRGGQNLTRYVDAFTASLYPLEGSGPEAELPLIQFAKSALPPAGRRKPLWNAEINYGARGGPAAKRISDARQASNVARTLLINANSRIRRVYWYGWDVGRVVNTHLRRSDGGLTRAGRAWNVVHSWMIDTDPRGCHRTESGPLTGLWSCRMKAGPDEVRRMYWKPSGDQVRITTVRSTRSWSDLGGHVTTRRGSFPLTVGPLPILVSSRE